MTTTTAAVADQLCEQYPVLEEQKIIDVLLPKKEQMLQLKWCEETSQLAHHRTIHPSPEKVSVLLVHNTPLFFSNRDGKWMPTLRLLHQYPDMMPKLRADEGAIKFVLAGMQLLFSCCTKSHTVLRCQHYVPRLDVARRNHPR